MEEKINWPSVSFIVCTYNCKEHAERCFKSILKQEYPREKIELIAVDGYSTDGTIEVLKNLKVKILFTKDRPERGAKTLGYKNARGEIVIIVDSDNALVENDWIKHMVKPLVTDKNVNFSICRMAVVKSDKAINRYLSLVGTDPVAAYKSIDALLALRKLNLVYKGEYYTYKIKSENFIVVGGYYFTIKKKTLESIGGYTQDTDVVYNLAKKGMANVAIPKRAHVHHLITNSITDFFKKKRKWAKVYFKEQIVGRDFKWIPKNTKEKLKLSLIMLGNLLFIPKLLVGIKMFFKDKESAWLLHPIATWLTTYAYLQAYISSKFN